MSRTYAANFVHCIFSTKDRRDIIPESLHEQLYAYLFGIAKNLRVILVAAGGTANHILCCPTRSVLLTCSMSDEGGLWIVDVALHSQSSFGEIF